MTVMWAMITLFYLLLKLENFCIKSVSESMFPVIIPCICLASKTK